MSNQQLYIWVEGPDDRRFVENIIKPHLQVKYKPITILEYAQKKTEYKENFIRSIIKMQADYIYLVDIDSTPCITTKKQKIQEEIKNIDINKIMIVCQEIESWYYAGLNHAALSQLGVSKPTKFKNTDTLTKEQFNNSIPKKFDSRIDYLQEILKSYKLEHISKYKTNK